MTDAMSDDLPEDVENLVFSSLSKLAPKDMGIGIALSGGSDSMALLHLAAIWAKSRGIPLKAATIDHRLRPEAGQEAIEAGRICSALGIRHQIIVWQDHPASGNIAQAARQARHRLLSRWASREGLAAIATGHTQDDLAETLLMRLRRGSGLDGLAAMAETSEIEGQIWLRPLLDCSRQGLRDWLTARGHNWVEDPSNSDPRYERARMRTAIAALGLETAALARSARLLAQARDAMSAATLAAAQGTHAENMELSLPLPAFLDAAPELQRRIFLAAINWIRGKGHPPRQSAVDTALAAIYAGRRTNLAGVMMTPRKDRLILTREQAFARRAPPPDAEGVWDNRFRIHAVPPGMRIAAMPDSPFPAIWDGQVCLGPAPATALRGIEQFFASLVAKRSR